jgi:hypothetical protein
MPGEQLTEEVLSNKSAPRTQHRAILTSPSHLVNPKPAVKQPKSNPDESQVNPKQTLSQPEST